MSVNAQEFLSGECFAVVGASKDRSKYGNKVLRAYVKHGRCAIPVNPNERAVEGLQCHPSLSAALSEHAQLDRASIITPPDITAKIVDDAIALQGAIRYLWMQPGAENPAAIARARAAGINVIAGGPCVLLELG